MAAIPELDIDLYGDDTLVHTNARYREMRDAGPVVYLPANAMYAVTQYESVRAALRADDVLISGRGVGGNALVNDDHTPTEITLSSDGEDHKRRRAVLTVPLTPAAMRDIQDNVARYADELVANLTRQSSFCVVKDFASHLPLSIVADLVGLSDYAKARMLEWAAATFNVMGGMNERTRAALPSVIEMQKFLAQLEQKDLREGSWAARVFSAADDGKLSHSEAQAMVLDYVGPSLDTTILASAHMFWLLATTSGVHESMRANPGLVPSIVNESVRLSSPIRGFTRYAAADFLFGDCTVPQGARVAVLYASGNWDERKYAQPDAFKVERDPKDHLSWGHGSHSCAGKHLARLEMEQLALALTRHAKSLLVGEPEMLMNNVLQGFAALPGQIR